VSETRTRDDDRLHALLCDRALEGLNDVEAHELDALLVDVPAAECASFEHAAAALHLALVNEPLTDVPAGLRRRLDRDADAFLAGREAAGAPAAVPAPAPRREPARPAAPAVAPTDVAPAAPPRGSTAAPPRPLLGMPVWGWLAAAGLLVWIVLLRDGGGLRTDDVVAELAAARDRVELAWAEAGDERAAGATGEVVWSGERQRGYMRFRDLTPNDASEDQYQLWIFDAERPEPTPVDGGVFDVPEGEGEVVVPIDPKLCVHEATAFVVTLERPGGVVVSKRERVLLAASVP